MNRRELIKLIGGAAALAAAPAWVHAAPTSPAHRPYLYCLNTATIRGQNLSLVEELDITAKAGFQAAEIWMDRLEGYIEKGGKLNDLKKRIDNLGIKIVNAIGFAPWIADDDNIRKNALEQLKKEMDQLAAIGCTRTAAPPAGATELPGLDLRKAGDRYRTILELGEKHGVNPQLELWGFSANLSNLSELLFVAAWSGHPNARILLDNYHLYKGGTAPESLKLVNPASTEIFHVNDYPKMERSAITDGDRTMPGDGVSPLKSIVSSLTHPVRPLILSVEIFSKHYYAQPALKAARTALQKLQLSLDQHH